MQNIILMVELYRNVLSYKNDKYNIYIIIKRYNNKNMLKLKRASHMIKNNITILQEVCKQISFKGVLY